MAGDVDDVVGARHDEEVAVLVHVARVRRLVVAGELVEIGRAEALSAFHSVGRQDGGSGSLTTMLPSVPAGTGWPASSMICTS
jgi:hypothetical protein